MPRTSLTNEVDVNSGISMSTYLPRMKQIVRWISKRNYTNPDAGFYAIAEVDAYVNSWIDQGYELKQVIYIGDNPEAYGVMYILVHS